MPFSGGSVGSGTNIQTATGDSGVCSISPSDLVGYVGNLVNRVKELEQKVAELQAQNITANQLSDISQQVGWVGGITYMGVDGWTMTEYGTLIPPAGVSISSLGITMSDGNEFPIVIMDENGVLQYGWTQQGEMKGEGGPGSFITFDMDGESSLGNLVCPINSVRDREPNEETDISWITYTIAESPTLQFNKSGVYAMFFQAEIDGDDAGVRLPCVATFMGTDASPASAIAFGASVIDEDIVSRSYINFSAVFEVPSGITDLALGENFFYPIYIEAMPVSGVHEFTVSASALTIAKLR